MHEDLKGFYCSPVSLGFIISTGLCSISPELLLAFKPSAAWQVLQFFLSPFVFQKKLAAVLGIYLLFRFRELERQFGSRKYASFVVVVLLLSKISMTLLFKQFPKHHISVATGPFPLIGALATLFYCNVPRLQPQMLKLFGISLSEKSFSFLLVALLCCKSWTTFLPFLSGAIIAYSYNQKGSILSRFRLPTIIVKIFQILDPILSVVPPSVQRHRRQVQLRRAQQLFAANPTIQQPNGQGFREQLIPGAGGVADLLRGRQNVEGAAPVHSTPPESSIEQLVNLGFDRDQSIRALIASNNNVEAAANRLLNSS